MAMVSLGAIIYSAVLILLDKSFKRRILEVAYSRIKPLAKWIYHEL